MGRARAFKPLALVLALAAAALLGSQLPAPPWLLLQGAQGVQGRVLAELLPAFHLVGLDVVLSDGQALLRARLVSTGFLVVKGQVLEPGVDFMAETPLRHGLFLAVLSLASAALALWRQAVGVSLAALAGTVSLAAALLLLTGPLVLAGEVWALIVPPWSEPTLAALLGGLSRLLLNGAGHGLAVGLAVALVQRAPVGPGRTTRR